MTSQRCRFESRPPPDHKCRMDSPRVWRRCRRQDNERLHHTGPLEKLDNIPEMRDVAADCSDDGVDKTGFFINFPHVSSS